MVIKDGSKMSKSKGNVVDPNDLIQDYGADTVRLFSLFAAPPEKDLEWSAQGVEGASRFLNRVYRLIMSNKATFGQDLKDRTPFNDQGKALHRKMHQTIRRVTESIEQNFHFNTAISAMMELFNVLSDTAGENAKEKADGCVISEAITVLLLLLSPMVPHFAAEMWNQLGKDTSIEKESWPTFDAESAREDLLTIVLQVNGKVRSRLTVPEAITDEQLTALALADENVIKFIEGNQVKKTIVVQKKLVNIVV
jgi:leucyl-tRNA synthetase